MKKIIAAFDGLKFCAGTLDYATFIAHHYNAHLVGVFLDDGSYTGYGYKALLEHASEKNIVEVLDTNDKNKREEAAQTFTEHCQQAGLQFSVHRDKKTAVKELLHESIYADLLIIGREESFEHGVSEIPSSFMHDLLADVACPVLLVPSKFKAPEKNILLYNGDPSSVYAVKMFSYLMAPFKHLPAEVLTINEPYTNLHLPDNKLMKEFLKRHFPNATFNVIEGPAEDEIIKYLSVLKEEAIVVLGAYQRNKLSRWFKQSMADTLMQLTKRPLFIAHNK